MVKDEWVSSEESSGAMGFRDLDGPHNRGNEESVVRMVKMNRVLRRRLTLTFGLARPMKMR